MSWKIERNTNSELLLEIGKDSVTIHISLNLLKHLTESEMVYYAIIHIFLYIYIYVYICICIIKYYYDLNINLYIQIYSHFIY